MKKISLKQLLLLGGFSGVAMLPIALAASCGSDSTPQVVVNTQKIKALKVEANSVHSQVLWPNQSVAAIKDASVQKYQFYSGPVLSYDAVSKLATNLWSDALPTSVNADSKLRAFWVRITPTANYTIDKPFLDLTASSGIDKVKTRIDETENFAALNLTLVTLSGALEAATIDTSAVTLPIGTKLIFTFKTQPFASKEELVAYLAENKATINPEDLLTIKASLEVTDASSFLLSNNKEAPVDISGVRFDPASTLPAAIYRPLNEYKVTSLGTHDAVTWRDTSTIVLPTDLVIGVKFLSGDYPTRLSAQNAPVASWTTELPTTVDYNHQSRHLWAQVTPTENHPLTDNLYDMTVSSNVQTVRSKIDASTQFASIDLTRLKLSGSMEAPVLAEAGVSLPQGAKITYNLGTSTWISGVDFVKYLVANKATITPVEIQDIQARLEPTDTLSYVLNNNKIAKPDVSGLQFAVPSIPASITAVLTTIKAKLVESASDNVSWEAVTIPATTAIKQIEYVEGNYALAADLKDVTTWSLTLPSRVGYDKAARHLWARAVAADGYVLTNPYFDLTASSSVQLVKTKIDAFPGFDALSLSAVKLAGNEAVITIDESTVTIPTGSRLEYSVDSTVWKNKAEFITLVGATPLTDVSKGAIKARLAATSADYVISNQKISAPDVSGIIITPIIPTSVTAYLTGITAKTEATHDVVVWNQGTFTPTDTIASIRFLSGDYATEALAKVATTWSATLPTAVSHTHAQRHLWAQFVPVVGKTLAIEFQDLTSSSQIQKVKSKVDALPGYDNVSFIDQISLLGGTFNNYRLDEPLLFLPEGSKVEFSWLNRFEGRKTGSELTTFLQNNTNTLNREVLAEIKAHLVPINDTYLVVNDKNSGIDISSLAVFGTVTEAPSVFANMFETVRLGATSTHASLIWDIKTTAIPSQLIGAFKNFTYLVGDYPDLASAKAAPAASWTTTPATSADLDPAKRFVWGRFNLTNGWALTNGYQDNVFVNLTTVSKIQDVLVSLDVKHATALATLDLTQVKISGPMSAIVIDTSSVTVPSDLVITYSINGTLFLERSLFIAGVAQQFAAATLTKAQFESAARVALEPVDNVHNVLSNNHVATPTITVV